MRSENNGPSSPSVVVALPFFRPLPTSPRPDPLRCFQSRVGDPSPDTSSGSGAPVTARTGFGVKRVDHLPLTITAGPAVHSHSHSCSHPHSAFPFTSVCQRRDSGPHPSLDRSKKGKTPSVEVQETRQRSFPPLVWRHSSPVPPHPTPLNPCPSSPSLKRSRGGCSSDLPSRGTHCPGERPPGTEDPGHSPTPVPSSADPTRLPVQVRTPD